ncbi:MAG TPA: carboxypeptidase regulatory-like domain-containing protein, partial [Verrucomicrobiae bacterium]|nr:carboxypeptidase regulatory-like domain-containing protein [Verrucomicrobiae bacterium]
MNAFTKLSLPLALAMTLNLRGATNDVSTFTGTVVDPDGNPVAGAAVDFYQYPSRTSPGPMEMEPQQHATTDGQGAFVLSNFDGQGVAVVTKTGVTPGWRTWYAVPEEPQKIALTAPSSLAGVVVDDAGRPVADAEVWVSVALSKTLTDYGEPSSLFGKIARDLFSAKTSADGKFRIENFPAGAQAVLSVKKSGMTLHQTSSPLRSDELPFHAGQEHITLTLNPAASVSGRVIVRGTGQPLAGAFVGLQPMVPGVRVLTLNMGTVVSTTDGSFQIHDVPAGSFQIMALWTNQPIADWVAEPVPLEVAAGQAVSGVQLQAYKGGVAEVTVLGKTKHEPIADASVSMSSGDFNGSGSTGTNGVVYFRLPPGQYTAFASKQDWSQAQMQTTVTEGRTTQATLELAAPSEVSGIVRDDSGAPVAGANVGVFPNYSGTGSGARTDANGRYELRWQKPSWAGSANQSFYLLARDSERKLAAVQEMDETTTNLDVTLKPAMNLSGSVQDTKGRAVTNAMAYIMLHMENMGFTITRQRIFSDEQGRIHAEALPKGERYELYVSAQGYGNARQEMQAADPKADHYDFPPLILKIADRKLAGRVLGTNGTPVADAQVWLNGEGQPNGNATTDARGWFHYDAVCEGALTVSANFKGLSGSAEAMGGDTNVVIRFSTQNRVYMASTPQTLTGTVFDSS